MSKVTKAIVDRNLREDIFSDIFANKELRFDYVKINDRQYGVLITDENGEERYVRIGVIVSELREDMTAEELMQSEIDAYNAKQEVKAEKAQKKAEKIAKDKAKREAEAKKKEEKNDDVA